MLVQYHTPLAVGTLLGMTTMMSQFMFVLFVVFLALAEYADSGGLASNDRAMAVFAFFLFLLYVSAPRPVCRLRKGLFHVQSSVHEASLSVLPVVGWAMVHSRSHVED